MDRVKFAAIAASLLASTAAWAGQTDWTISEANGQVTVTSAGSARAAQRGLTLRTGDSLRTGPAGRAVVVRSGEYMVVSPGSHFEVADPKKSGGLTQIIERAGTIVFKIKKMLTPHFGVETPYLAAVVKGTTFSVSVTPTGASVQVVEGKVEVATNDGGARYLVMPGDIGAVSADAPRKLQVQGRENRTIESTAAAPSDRGGSAVVTPAAAPLPEAATIEVAIAEPPVNLESVTSGLVTSAGSVAPTVPAPSSAAEPTVSNADARSSESANASGAASASTAAVQLAGIINGNAGNGGTSANAGSGSASGNSGSNGNGASNSGMGNDGSTGSGNNGSNAGDTNGNGNGGSNGSANGGSSAAGANGNGNGASNGGSSNDDARNSSGGGSNSGNGNGGSSSGGGSGNGASNAGGANGNGTGGSNGGSGNGGSNGSANGGSDAAGANGNGNGASNGGSSNDDARNRSGGGSNSGNGNGGSSSGGGSGNGASNAGGANGNGTGGSNGGSGNDNANGGGKQRR